MPFLVGTLVYQLRERGWTIDHHRLQRSESNQFGESSDRTITNSDQKTTVASGNEYRTAVVKATCLAGT